MFVTVTYFVLFDVAYIQLQLLSNCRC